MAKNNKNLFSLQSNGGKKSQAKRAKKVKQIEILEDDEDQELETAGQSILPNMVEQEVRTTMLFIFGF